MTDWDFIIKQCLYFMMQAEHLAQQPTAKWPYIVQTPNQTIVRCQGMEWLTSENLQVGLGHLVMIMSLFELPQKARPQLLLILESLFYGYTAPNLQAKNVILVNKIRQLSQGAAGGEDNEKGTTNTSLSESYIVESI